AGDDVAQELVAVEGGQGAHSAVHGHVTGLCLMEPTGTHIGEVTVVEAGLEEVLGGRLVLLCRQLGEASGTPELGHNALVGVLGVALSRRRVKDKDGAHTPVGDALKVAPSHLDDVEAHVDDVTAAGAVVPGPGEALEGVVQVPAVQVVVPQVVVAPPAQRRQRTPSPPDALLDGVALVVLEVRVQLLQLQGRLLALGLDPLAVHLRRVRPALATNDGDLPGRVHQLLVDLLVLRDVVRRLHVGQGHPQRLHAKRGAVVRDVEETVQSCQPSVAVGVGLQVLQTRGWVFDNIGLFFCCLIIFGLSIHLHRLNRTL
ncbi:unnamed protein product, partial [Ixodes pacificus]